MKNGPDNISLIIGITPDEDLPQLAIFIAFINARST